MRVGSTGTESLSFLPASTALLAGTARGTAEAIISSGGFGWVKVNGNSSERSLSHTQTVQVDVWL